MWVFGMMKSAATAANPHEVVWRQLSNLEVQKLAEAVFGIQGDAVPMPSERDETFKLFGSQGCYVVKIANPAEDLAVLSYQDGALIHLEEQAPELPVPRLVRTLEREPYHTLIRHGATHFVRLFTFLQGEQLSSVPVTVPQSAELGRLLALLDKGLSSYGGRQPPHKLLWDISNTLDLADRLESVDVTRRRPVEDVLVQFERQYLPERGTLRRQNIHNDFNPYNLLVDMDAPQRITAVLDFGDMVGAPVVHDLAVALSYRLGAKDWAKHLRRFVAGYFSVQELTEQEKRILPLLIKARFAMTIIVTEWRAALRPQNRDYILRNHPSAWRGLQNLSAVSDTQIADIIDAGCGENINGDD
jgi:Ser/Thr protein kinase RdoA (MazF antagonist)